MRPEASSRAGRDATPPSRSPRATRGLEVRTRPPVPRFVASAPRKSELPGTLGNLNSSVPPWPCAFPGFRRFSQHRPSPRLQGAPFRISPANLPCLTELSCHGHTLSKGNPVGGKYRAVQDFVNLL